VTMFAAGGIRVSGILPVTHHCAVPFV